MQIMYFSSIIIQICSSQIHLTKPPYKPVISAQNYITFIPSAEAETQYITFDLSILYP